MMRLTMVASLSAWLFLMSLAVTGNAYAEPQLVGILSIETRGVSEATAEQFEAEVEQALKGVGMQSVGRVALRKKLDGSDYMEGCLFGPCLAALRGATGVPIVLVANIHGNGSNYNFVITLINTKTGAPTSQVSQNCAVCTIEEAISTATLTTISVLTGSGDAKQSASEAPLETVSPAPEALRASARLRSVRRTGLIFLGLGAVGGIAGAYLYNNHRDPGLVALSSGVGFVTSGATMLLLSRHF